MSTILRDSSSKRGDLPKLLISVKNVGEALIARECGADIIDIKNPAQGSLGAPSLETIQRVTEKLSTKIPLSVALGECVEMDPDVFQFSNKCWNAFQFVKMGLAKMEGVNWKQKLLNRFQHLPAGCNRVLVSYVDYEKAKAPLPQQVVDAAEFIGAKVILFDTYAKDGSTLFDHVSHSDLKRMLGQANKLNIATVIAGGIALDDIPNATSLYPDCIAVRGAACSGSRTGKISPEAILNLKRALNSSSCNIC